MLLSLRTMPAYFPIHQPTMILILIGLLILALWLAMSPLYWKFRGVPSHLPLLFFGNSLPSLRTSVIDFFDRVYNSIGDDPYIGLHLFVRPALLVKDPDIIQTILVKDADYFASHGFYTNPGRDGVHGNMFFSDGDRWKDLRAKMSPTLTPGRVRKMMPAIRNSMKTVVDIIVKSGTIDAYDLMTRHSTHISVAFTFGTESDVYENNSVFREIKKSMFDPGTTLAAFTGMISKPFYNLFKLTFFSVESTNFIKKLTQDLIEQRENSSEKRWDFLQTIIDLIKSDVNSDLPQKFPDGTEVSRFRADLIAPHTTLFFAASIDTPGLLVAYALYELALNQKCQDKVREEVLKNVENIEEISYNELAKLTYTSMCLNETLRKYSILPVLTRRCTNDYIIEKTGLKVEKETPVIIPVHAIHWDPKYYPDPEEFRPERFAVPKLSGTFMPFGLGPRYCLGMKLALVEAAYTLATLVAKFYVSLDAKETIPLQLSSYHFFNTPRDGIWLQFKPLLFETCDEDEVTV